MSDNTYVLHFTRNRKGRRQLFADNNLYGNVFSPILFENLKRFWKNYIHLQEWKVETEKDYQNFTPRRHRKILGPPIRESIRG